MYETDDKKMYAAVRCDAADKEAVEPLVKLLDAEGIAVDYAENLTMANTAAAIVFFSKTSIENGTAKRNYGSAKKGGALIVPVVLDKSDPHDVPELDRLLGRKEIVYTDGLKPAAIIRKIVYMLPTSVKYNKPEEEVVEEKEIPTGVSVGKCPLCGGIVRKGNNDAYDCEEPDCNYSLSFETGVRDQDNPESILTKKIKLDNVLAQTLLKGGKIEKNLKQDDGKVFKARLVLDPETHDSLIIAADKRGAFWKKRKV